MFVSQTFHNSRLTLHDSQFLFEGYASEKKKAAEKHEGEDKDYSAGGKYQAFRVNTTKYSINQATKWLEVP